MMSPSFIASDFIYDEEIPAINERLQNGARVVPVYLKQCSFGMICSELHAVPHFNRQLRAVEDWDPRNPGFHAIREGIAKVVKDHLGLIPRLPRLALPRSPAP